MEFITSLLRKIEKPARYFAPFIEPVKVSTDDSKPKILILFPDLFEIAQSHTGVKILYSLFHRRGFRVDFGFAPQKDFFEIARKNGGLASIMHNINFRDFDMICVSFQYQLQYPAFLKILEICSIPFYSKDRINSDAYPLIIAGGPIICNPEPIADFVDAEFIGEFEPSAFKVMEVLENIKEKSKRLEAFSKIEGFYIPSTMDGKNLKINEDGSLRGFAASRSILPDLNYDLDSLFDAPLFAMRTVHDRFTIEIMRGCTRGCRFCMAGMFYRPHREKNAENVCKILDKAVALSGYDEAGFLSLSAADHSEIEKILLNSFNRRDREISISLPSLRTETLTPEIVKAIKRGRKSGFTLAPESGSERVRKAINKTNGDEDLLNAIEAIFSNGWQNVKLYFMLGLPLEEDEDIFATVRLIKRMCAHIRKFGKNRSIAASFSTFVPQPFTPFQWEKMASPEEIIAKQKIIIENLRGVKNLKLSWRDPKISGVEGYLSRAGREYGKVIQFVAENMKGLQTEDESFDADLWQRAMAESKIDPKSTYREKSPAVPLPYEHIDLHIDRRFLLKEREKAYNFETTEECARGECQKCGVCDFKKIRPRLNLEESAKNGKELDFIEKKQQKGSFPYIFSLSKTGKSISVGHLDLVSFLFKALALCNLKILYSEGFHPLPRFNLTLPAPVGVEVEEEFGSLWLAEEVNEAQSLKKLNEILKNSGISFKIFHLVDRELLKKAEKILRSLPFHPYKAIFKDKGEFAAMKKILNVVSANERELAIIFEHPVEKGGVLKQFANLKGDFHIIKQNYREIATRRDLENVFKKSGLFSEPCQKS